jgi:hypothetical protein
MTILTDEQVRALLDGATPGPWRLIDDPEAGEPAQCIRAKGWDIATAWGGYSAAESDANLLCAAPDLARDLLDARAELARMRDALEDQADFLDQMHHARMTGLGRDPDKYTTELSAQRDKIRAALTQEPKP